VAGRTTSVKPSAALVRMLLELPERIEGRIVKIATPSQETAVASYLGSNSHAGSLKGSPLAVHRIGWTSGMVLVARGVPGSLDSCRWPSPRGGRWRSNLSKLRKRLPIRR
jgi:hypothetical protein